MLVFVIAANKLNLDIGTGFQLPDATDNADLIWTFIDQIAEKDELVARSELKLRQKLVQRVEHAVYITDENTAVQVSVSPSRQPDARNHEGEAE